MAIVVEEKSSINWVSILTVFVILVLVFGGGYYLFFKKPELIEIVLPSFDPLNQISQITIDPEEVVQSANFKILRSFTTDLTIPPSGRSDPFRPF